MPDWERDVTFHPRWTALRQTVEPTKPLPPITSRLGTLAAIKVVLLGMLRVLG